MKVRRFKKTRLTRSFRDTVMGAPLADVVVLYECIRRKVKNAGRFVKKYLKDIGLLGT